MTCKPEGYTGEDADRPGGILARELVASARDKGIDVDVVLKGVDCLSVCKRPCTVSVSGAGKFTYVIGDLEPGRDVDDILAFALLYGESADGITKWRDRPVVVRKHTIARVPPIGSLSNLVGDIENKTS
jgi:predicted metal-binding protein